MNKNKHSVKDGGSITVEFAVLAPLLFLMMVGAADFARIFYNAITVANASGTGSFYGSMNTIKAGDFPTIQLLAEQDAADLQAPAATATLYCDCPGSTTSINCIDGDCGAYGAPRVYSRTVVQQTFDLMLPWPGVPEQVVVNRESYVRVQ